MFQLIYTFSQHTEGFQVSILSSQKNFTKLNRKLNIFRFPFQWLRTEAFITHFIPLWGFRLRTQTVKFICSDSWTDWMTVTAGVTCRGNVTLSQEGKGNRYLRTLGSNYYRQRWLIEWDYFSPPLGNDFILFLLDFLIFLVALGIYASAKWPS